MRSARRRLIAAPLPQEFAVDGLLAIGFFQPHPECLSILATPRLRSRVSGELEPTTGSLVAHEVAHIVYTHLTNTSVTSPRFRDVFATGDRLLLDRPGSCKLVALDLASGDLEELRSEETDAVGECELLTFSPDLERAVLGTLDGRIVVIDSRGRRSFRVGEGRLQPLWVSPRNTYSLLFSPQSSQLLLWDLERDVLVGSLPDQDIREFAVKTSPDERLLASLGADYSIVIRRLPGMDPGPTLRGHTWKITSLAFSPDGRLLASSDWEGLVRLWDVERGVEARPPLQGHLSGVIRVDFSPDGRTISTTSGDESVRLWSVATSQELLRIPNAQGFWTAPVIASHGNALVWSRGMAGKAWWRNVEVTKLPSLSEIDRVRGAHLDGS